MDNADIFALLDTEIDAIGSGNGRQITGRIPIPGLSHEDIESLKVQGNPVAALAIETTDKAYITLHKHKNVVSNSILSSLHSCPRRFIQEKIKANNRELQGLPEQPNIDFVFGHSVGAGVQCYLAFDCNIEYGIFAAFLAWRYDFDFGREDYYARKKKTIERALLAVQIFNHWWTANFSEWEIYRLPDGKPAVELSFCIDFGKYKYFGHIDLILRNKRTGRIAIGENKTTGYSNPHPAVYQNSGQALGYAIVLDKIVGQLADYDVLYYAYSSVGEEWHHFPFAKTTAAKLEWVQDRFIDNGHVEQYFKLQHFPKNGGSCFQFNRPCQFFGDCDIVDRKRMEALPVLDDVDAGYPVDFCVHVNDIIVQQAEKV
jgi:hypothetical protein